MVSSSAPSTDVTDRSTEEWLKRMNELPHFIRIEQAALITEIEDAFDGFSRQGGVSWAEAEIADGYGSIRTVERVRGRRT